MNDTKSEPTLGKKMIALTAVMAFGLGISLTGCAPDDVAPPPDPDQDPALPGTLPGQPPEELPEPPEEPEEEPQY